MRALPRPYGRTWLPSPHLSHIEVVAEAGTGVEAIEAANRHRPDVILMDIRMPEMDGLEATSRILTTFDPDEYVYRALRAGASGFVLKDIPPGDLVSAVRTVADGGALLAPSITRRLVQAARRSIGRVLLRRVDRLPFTGHLPSSHGHPIRSPRSRIGPLVRRIRAKR